MSDQTPEAGDAPSPTEGRRKRGAGFPQTSLPAAVKIIHEAGQHGTEHTMNAFAGYCGSRTSNSGSFKQRLAAFRDWNLVSTAGDRVIITDRGKIFARSQDPLTDVAALTETFLSCKIMHDFYEDVPRNKPQKADWLRRKAVVDFRVSSDTVDRFIISLRESAAAAGLAEVDEASSDITFVTPLQAKEDQEPSPPSDTPQETPVDTVKADISGKATPSFVSGAPAVLKQSWPTTHGEVVLSVNSSQPLSAEAFTLIAEAVKAVSRLAEHLGSPGDALSGDAS